jgi:ABC-2 type transport system ATP-binding protein
VTVAPAAVTVDRLTKRFGSQLAVDDLSFEVPAGKVVGFLGPNGSGKSTTLRMIVGLTAPTSGRALIGGVPFHDLDRPAEVVGSIVDGVGHHPARRAIDELRISALAAGLPSDRCEAALELVGLADAARKRVGAYSLGMRQRLGIAQALLGDPRVLLLDEPANGLDPEGIRWIRSLLRHLADEGRTVLVSSHLIGEVARLADDVIVIREGRFVTQASVTELTAVATGGAIVRSLDDVTLTARLRAAGADVVADPDQLTVRGVAPELIGRTALEAGIVVTELRPVRAELEDVFLELTGPTGSPVPADAAEPAVWSSSPPPPPGGPAATTGGGR